MVLARGGLATVPRGSDLAGARLSEEKETILATLAFCTLAIEARANHLIDRELEKKTISQSVRNAAVRLRPQDKWFLLPRIAGRARDLDDARMLIKRSPQSAVSAMRSCTSITLSLIGRYRTTSQLRREW